MHDERGNEIAEYNTSLVLQRKLYYDPSQLAPIAMSNAAGAVTFNYFDRSGSVVAIADAAGVKQFHYAYLPFGDSHPSGTPISYCQGTTCGDASGTGFGYVGYRYDYETGLYRTGARYYDPRLGRFLQMDPIGQAGGLNFYAYVENDPLNLTDPSGMASISEYLQRGIRVVNSAITGSHPVTGIPFKGGFPDFSSVAKHTVQLESATGSRKTDAALANALAGLDRTPAGYVWHHHQDGRTMQLVPSQIHGATGHTGGAAWARAAADLAVDIATDPTTYLKAGIGVVLSTMSPSPAGACSTITCRGGLAAGVPVTSGSEPTSFMNYGSGFGGVEALQGKPR